MNAVSEDVKDLLVTAGVGTFKAASGCGIYINFEPEEPDTSITIYDTGGPTPGLTADVSQAPYRFSSFQVRVRGPNADYAAVLGKIQLVQSTLETKTKFTAGSARYERFMTTIEPAFLRVDENQRVIWVASFEAQRHAT